jgi:hypothetical protein
MGMPGYDKEQLHRHLHSGSSLAMLLKGHLWVEVMLEDAIREAVFKPEHLDLDRLAFPAKVSLAAALDLVSEDDLPAYRKLNALRNRFAHDLKREELTSSDATELLETLSPRMRAAARAGVAGIDEKRSFRVATESAIAAMVIGSTRSAERLFKPKKS